MPLEFASAVISSPFIFLGISVLSALVVRWNQTRRLRLPPGPKPLPIFGNMFDMPLHEPWLVYRDWCNKYGITLSSATNHRSHKMVLGPGDVVYLDLPFQPTLILGSAKASLDLMEKRSHLYSDRVPCRMDEL